MRDDGEHFLSRAASLIEPDPRGLGFRPRGPRLANEPGRSGEETSGDDADGSEDADKQERQPAEDEREDDDDCREH